MQEEAPTEYEGNVRARRACGLDCACVRSSSPFPPARDCRRTRQRSARWLTWSQTSRPRESATRRVQRRPRAESSSCSVPSPARANFASPPAPPLQLVQRLQAKGYHTIEGVSVCEVAPARWLTPCSSQTDRPPPPPHTRTPRAGHVRHVAAADGRQLHGHGGEEAARGMLGPHDLRLSVGDELRGAAQADGAHRHGLHGARRGAGRGRRDGQPDGAVWRVQDGQDTAVPHDGRDGAGWGGQGHVHRHGGHIPPRPHREHRGALWPQR